MIALRGQCANQLLEQYEFLKKETITKGQNNEFQSTIMEYVKNFENKNWRQN